MVELIPYHPELLSELHFMLESQHYYRITDINTATLPKIGYIAVNYAEDDSMRRISTPISAGFLRMVEGGFAQIDTLMSNARLPSELRHEGISKIVDKLIEDAKKLNLHGILAMSKDESTIKRAISIGFHVVSEQRLIALPLKELSTDV